MRLQPHRHVFRKRAGVVHREGARTKIEIVVFEPHGPVVPQRVVHARARSPTSAGTTTPLIERGRDRCGLEVVCAREGRAALQVKKRRIEHVADSTGTGPKPTLPRPTRAHAVWTNAFVLQVAPSGVAFGSQNPFSNLVIESDLAAEHGGVARFREGAVAERPIAIRKAGAEVAPDIKPAPIIGGDEGRRLRRDERVGGLGASARKQSNSRDASEEAHDWPEHPAARQTHRLPILSPKAAALVAGSAEKE